MGSNPTGPTEIEDKQTPQLPTCNICYDPIPVVAKVSSSSNLSKIWCQRHPTCSACLTLYLEGCIAEGKSIFPCCQGARQCEFVGDWEKLRNFLAPFYQDLYRKNCLQWEWSGAVCQKCSRSKFRLASFDPSIQNCVQVYCLGCESIFCLFCREIVSTSVVSTLFAFRRPLKTKPLSHLAFSGHRCKDPAVRSLAEHVTDATNCIRPCPHCFKLVYRFEGCNHMFCSGTKGCQKYWCWECISPTRPNSEHHVCHKNLPQPRIVVSEIAKSAAETAVKVVVVPARVLVCCVTAPVLAYNSYLEEKERKRILVSQRIAQSGIDVYIVPGGVPNVPGDPLDESEAVAFVQSFVDETGGNGRWIPPPGIGTSASPATCFLSYSCLDGKAIVRVHPHAENDQRCVCLQSESAFRASSVHVLIDELTGWQPPSLDGTRSSSKNAQRLVEKECLKAIHALGLRSFASLTPVHV